MQTQQRLNNLDAWLTTYPLSALDITECVDYQSSLIVFLSEEAKHEIKDGHRDRARYLVDMATLEDKTFYSILRS